MSRQNPQREKQVKRPKREVIIVIVDGYSDKTLLEVSLSEFFAHKFGDDIIVRFALLKCDDGNYGGDITSLYGSTPEKIEMLINTKIIFPELGNNDISTPESENEKKIYAKEVSKIIHIIDTDGVFIQDEKVVAFEPGGERPIDGHILYFEDHIATDDVDGIRERNARKRANIKKLMEFHQEGFPIRKYVLTENRGNKATTKSNVVPYSLFFFSINMDHFTSNALNIEGGKKALAQKFIRIHGDGYADLRKFIEENDPQLSAMSYEESWEYIMKDCNSLKRHTNLGRLFDSF
ncbi:MAG: hypothetical protein IKH30_09500 [Clostridia bacterium]|nr:hypothetical protein [Clostridia bacterium]